MNFTIRYTFAVPCAILIVAALTISGCNGANSTSGQRPAAVQRPTISENGNRIQFHSEWPGLRHIRSVAMEKGTATIPVITPARVVACTATGLSSKDQMVLFESPDLTSLYSQYRQGRANTERTVKNLERIRAMYANQASTAKDLNEAETEAASVRASMAESEAKLRAFGLNPLQLVSVTTPTAWLMCDVPESQLHEVQKGEEVDIVFSSYPDLKIVGHEEATGEVVDPVTRTVKVRVSTSNRQGRFLPGMFARVDFGDPVPGVVVLPNDALVTVEGVDYVFVQADSSTFERRRITLGSSGTAESVVLKGLNGGEHVVVEGAMLLKGLSFGY